MVEISNSKKSSFFCNNAVDKGCYGLIRTIFDTLLLQKKCKQQDLADYLGFDKSYISRVVNGLQVPPLRIQLKIAKFFGVDTRLIWRDQKTFLEEHFGENTKVSLPSNNLNISPEENMIGQREKYRRGGSYGP